MFYDRRLLVVSMCQYYKRSRSQKHRGSENGISSLAKISPKQRISNTGIRVTLSRSPECGTLGPTRTLRVKYFRCLQGICDEANPCRAT